MLANNTPYTVAGRTRRVFRLTPSFVWFRETDGGMVHERVLGRKLFEKWLRGIKNAA
jgi:hypothetical protein